LEKIIAELQSEKKKLEKIRDEHIQLKITHDTTKSQLEAKTQRVEKLEQEVTVHKDKITDLKAKLATKETELKEQDKIKGELRQQIKEGEKLLEASNIEGKKKDLVINDKDAIILQLKQEIEEWRNKYNNLSDQFNKKQTQLKEYINDIEKERNAKREAQRELK
jgi:chromosome segregation ATPase